MKRERVARGPEKRNGRTPGGRAGALALLVACLLPAAALAQLGAGLAELRAPPDPFAAGRVLEARELRGLKAGVANLVLSAGEGGEIATAVLAVPLPSTGRLALFVEIDGPTLLRHNQAQIPQVEVYAYAVAGAAVAGHLGEVFSFDLEKLEEAVSRSGFKLYSRLELPPGSYSLRVLVRHRQSGATGVRVLPVELPEAGRAVFSPLFPEAEDRWLAVRGAAGGPADRYPFVATGRALMPAARPVLFAGRETGVHLFGAERLAGPWSGSVQLLAPEPGTEGILAEAELSSLVAGAPEEGGPSVRFRLPKAPPGQYLLRIELRSPAGRTARSAAVPVWILTGDSRERELLWTDLRWMVAGAGPVPAGAAARPVERGPVGSSPRRGSPSRRVRRLAESYRAVLRTLARDGPAAARAALLELESETLGRGPGRLEALRAAELQVAGELAQRQAESLVPLLALHLEGYREGRDRRLHTLIAHGRTLVEVLAELYAEHGGSRTLAADALAALGGDLQEAGLYGMCHRLYARALELEPGHRAALLGLATGLEKTGHYRRAVEVLERLAEGAELAEGRLRLAINLGRMGDRKRARELLAEIAAGVGEGWVRSLAYRELARSLLEAGSPERAAELLGRAVAERPGDQGLRLLLAHVHDRLQQPREALELVRGVRPRPGEAFRSPARIYDSWPRAALEEARRSLGEAAGERRESLGRFLEDRAESGP